MREHLFELSMAELKNLYICETKALTFALNDGVLWEDLEYIRESIKDLTQYINAEIPLVINRLHRLNGDILAPLAISLSQSKDISQITHQSPGSIKFTRPDI